MEQALTGIKVVDASRVLAGPFAAQILADHGADVIKVEGPDGDECRGFGPPFEHGSAAYFNAVNRNKRAITVDLGKAAGRKLFFRMLSTADVLIENFKISTLKAWGIASPQELSSLYPKLVHCRITGFGDSGPMGGKPGYDAAVQAIAGLMSINGEPNSNPLRLGVPVVDLTTGMNTAMAALLALQERTRTGRGQIAEVCLYDSAVSMAHPYLANFLASNVTPKSTGNAHPNIVPYNVYSTNTGPVFLAIANDRQFRALCDALNVPQIAADERFATNRARVRNRLELEPILGEALATVDGVQLGRDLLSRNIPVSPIFDVGQVAAAEHTRHREMVIDAPHYTGPGVPIKLSRTPAQIKRRAPQMDEDRASILAELGLAAEELAELEASATSTATAMKNG